MPDTLPGELRWELREHWAGAWEVRCAVCRERRYPPPWIVGDDAEAAARYATGRGWRCVAGRWVCPGCAR